MTTTRHCMEQMARSTQHLLENSCSLMILVISQTPLEAMSNHESWTVFMISVQFLHLMLSWIKTAKWVVFFLIYYPYLKTFTNTILDFSSILIYQSKNWMQLIRTERWVSLRWWLSMLQLVTDLLSSTTKPSRISAADMTQPLEPLLLQLKELTSSTSMHCPILMR